MRSKETVLITGASGSLAKKVKKQLVKIGYNVITYTSDKKKVKAFNDGLKILIYFFKKYLNFINKK